ncbi:MAG: hypothetical protein ABWY14_06715, partial [Tardiphaga sp.]
MKPTFREQDVQIMSVHRSKMQHARCCDRGCRGVGVARYTALVSAPSMIRLVPEIRLAAGLDM